MSTTDIESAPEQVDMSYELRVHSIREAAEDVRELRLVSPQGEPLPSWGPGAHVDVVLPSGLIRQYSLCGHPDDPTTYRLGVLLAPNTRGGSEEVHRLSEGASLSIRGPRNNFVFLPATKYVFIAGGIGITPILPMVRAAHEAGADWTLYYGGRALRTMGFIDELKPYGDRVILYPEDTKGFIPFGSILTDHEALVYCCGPEPMLAAVQTAMANWPADRLHLERFVPPARVHDVDTAFEVELKQSGLTLTVPENETIVSVAREAGVLVFTSCEEGMCGTCETRVLFGHPDHRDSVKDPEMRNQEGNMAVCVSRSEGPFLALDL